VIRLWPVLLALLAGIIPAAAPRAGEAPPLMLDEVLATSARHFPGILEAIAKRRGAEGKLTEAQGAFDLVFASDGFTRTSGFYDGATIEGKATQPLGPLGASVFSSYGISRGDFPIYEDEYFTNEDGRLKVGVMFSLLRDRTIDERRFGVTDARLAVEAAELELLMTRIGVQRRAIEAYWRWVNAGQQLAVYEELLKIAEDREAGLETQVARGALAEIALTENRQNITRRRILKVSAGGAFRRAAYDLAMYYRDLSGEPRLPSRERLPDAVDATIVPQLTAADMPAILERQPALRALRNAIERAQRRVTLSQNDLKPRLDLSFELNEPFGEIGEGGESRDTTESIVGLTFTVPLQQRGAKGALDASRAELQALRAERRGLSDQLELEMLDVLVRLEVTQELTQLAAREVDQARTLMEAERRRFSSGASDFFLVNIREETAANARIRFLTADLNAHIARAEYDAATINLSKLGLSVPR
jgi:outer membrane protein TolC